MILKVLFSPVQWALFSSESGAIGAAQIARDIAHGKREIMGIKVEL